MIRNRPSERSPGLRRTLAAAAVLAALLSGCATRTGVFHRVERGQTAYRIARTYGIDVRKLLDVNGIADPRALEVGQMLWIPGATRLRRVPPAGGTRSPEIPLHLSGKHLVMPLKGPISSGFGMRHGHIHKGIDILAHEGAPVRAAGYGIVVYAGNGMHGYGNAVVLDHGDGVTTLYAHLKSIRVESGDAVAAGSIIGTVGETGNATTPHLHFELRHEGRAVAPRRYLERTAGGP